MDKKLHELPKVQKEDFDEVCKKLATKLQKKWDDGLEAHHLRTNNFEAFTRIAHNIIMDTYRQQKNEHIVEPTEDNDLSKLKSESLMDINRENEFVNAQILSDVRHIMDNLPAPQREVVYMRFYQEMSFKEIAETTGVSINTSLGRMRYAVLNMRRMAKQHHIHLQLD